MLRTELFMAIIDLVQRKLADVERRAQEAKGRHLVVDDQHARHVVTTLQIEHSILPSSRLMQRGVPQTPADLRRRGFCTNAPTMSLNNPLADRELESRSVSPLRGRYAVELIEDPL